MIYPVKKEDKLFYPSIMLKKEISLIPLAPTILSSPLLQKKRQFVAERLFSKPPVNMLSSEPPSTPKWKSVNYSHHNSRHYRK